MTHATGTFEVKLASQATDAAGIDRRSIDKQFHGDLEATSKGEMLSAVGEVKGSAGYVAMERVTGTLGGKKGSFVLQHNGVMNRGTATLSVTVVPDSGTGELAGLSGKMEIRIEGARHSYEMEYSVCGLRPGTLTRRRRDAEEHPGAKLMEIRIEGARHSYELEYSVCGLRPGILTRRRRDAEEHPGAKLMEIRIEGSRRLCGMEYLL